MRVFYEVLLHALVERQTLVAPEAVQHAVGVLETLLAEVLVEVAERQKCRIAQIVHVHLVPAFALFVAREDPATNMVPINLEDTYLLIVQRNVIATFGARITVCSKNFASTC